ncbi:MAG TPA: FAD-dependent oxidoreductase [Usitatibacter sp.]|nr:FAD-dependent oxidoreductase [Usitatibacter sp.]
MAIHEVTLQSRETVAEGTQAFHFSRPADFTFKPGQAIDLILPTLEGPDPDAAKHAFSIVNAPGEPGLTIATRMRPSAFKRALGELKPGDKAKVDGPFGSLTLHKDPARDALFVAGGIGITPFMSIVRHGASANDARRRVLMYSNRRPEDAAFLAELEALSKAGHGLSLVATMTEMQKSALPWAGESRLLDAAMVRAAVAGLARPIAYLAGPPAMVAAAREILIAAGVDEDDIRAEEFFGY